MGKEFAESAAVTIPHNKRMQTDVAYGHAADAERYAV